MTPRDPELFVSASLILLLALAGLALWAVFRRRAPIPVAVEDQESAQVSLAPSPEPKAPPPEAKKDPNPGEARFLADGRPRCLASPSCEEEATHMRPRIVRSDGVVDFIRRAFGAPRRYRMAEKKAWWERLKAHAKAKANEPVTFAPDFCHVHVHLARQICFEHLAADEHKDQQAQRAREVELAYFEQKGLTDRVRALVAEIEMERDEKKGRKRLRSTDQPPASVVPIQRNGTTGATPN